jgi:hypothetical protein
MRGIVEACLWMSIPSRRLAQGAGIRQGHTLSADHNGDFADLRYQRLNAKTDRH